MTLPLITTPQEVELLSKEKENEYHHFRTFIKTKSSKEVDKVVHQLNENVSRQIDCTQCGNCCKKFNAAMDKKEARRVGSELNLKRKEFTDKYCEFDDSNNIFFIKNLPCVFLKENKCTVYEKRPAACAEFPHLNKPNFIFRTGSVWENYKVCPIVYNVVEQLKAHYNFTAK